MAPRARAAAQVASGVGERNEQSGCRSAARVRGVSIALLSLFRFSIAYGLGFSVPWLVLAVLLRAGLVAAVGVAVGVRYRSITHFLLPMIALSLAFDLPVLWYLELWPTPLFYLWPTLPSLLLAKAAFLPVDALQLVYACVYGTVVLGAAVFWASRALDRFVVRGELGS